jgi:hypothetical protein
LRKRRRRVAPPRRHRIIAVNALDADDAFEYGVEILHSGAEDT